MAAAWAAWKQASWEGPQERAAAQFHRRKLLSGVLRKEGRGTGQGQAFPPRRQHEYGADKEVCIILKDMTGRYVGVC